MNRLIDVIRNRQQNNTAAVKPVRDSNERQEAVLISRNANVKITSSARGNLGPPSVLNQVSPGTNWLKDRWQAASDMHGSAIPGTHWVIFNFSELFNNNNHGAVYITKIVLDWETAFASDYRIETRIDAPTTPSGQEDEWCVLYDAGKEEKFAIGHQDKSERFQYPHVSNEEHGQSPGVKEKLPLHIIHTIDWTDGSDLQNSNCHSLRYLRIFIRKSARGWGVSLWQVDVFGYETVER